MDSVRTDIREYAEGYCVSIETDQEHDRLVIVALNEGGFNGTSVDLLDVLQWVRVNQPELLL